MHYSKSMIEQIFLIRKSVPDKLRPKIKLVDPNLFDTLTDVYWSLQDNRIRAHIERLMSMAGPAWTATLKGPSAPAKDYKAPPAKKTYRGQPVYSESASATQASSRAPKSAASGNLVYRGRQVQCG